MNPLNLLQLLSPILRQLPRQARQELMDGLKLEARAGATANRMISRGSNTHKSAIRDPMIMFDVAEDGSKMQTDILDMLTDDFGGNYNPDKLEDARDILYNIMNKRIIKRRR